MRPLLYLEFLRRTGTLAYPGGNPKKRGSLPIPVPPAQMHAIKSRPSAMAKKKKVAGADIDWYLISIERLKQIGLVLLLLILGGAGWWYWSHQKGNPRRPAEAAIGDAREPLTPLAASTHFA